MVTPDDKKLLLAPALKKPESGRPAALRLLFRSSPSLLLRIYYASYKAISYLISYISYISGHTAARPLLSDGVFAQALLLHPSSVRPSPDGVCYNIVDEPVMILLMNLLYIFSLMNLLYIFSLTNLNIILFDQSVTILLTNLLYPQASSNCSASQQRPTFGLNPFTEYFDKFTSSIKIPFLLIKCLLLFCRTWRQMQVPQRQWEEV